VCVNSGKTNASNMVDVPVWAFFKKNNGLIEHPQKAEVSCKKEYPEQLVESSDACLLVHPNCLKVY
jgi:hypothetical protein